MMFFYKVPSGCLETNSILFGNDGIGAVVDASPGSAKKIFQAAQENGLKIEKILLTHSHWDHIADAHALKQMTNASVYIHALDAKNLENPGSDGLPLSISIPPLKPDFLLKEGDVVLVGKLRLEVIHTPGHTPGSICFYLASEALLFAGDTLFHGAFGRTDLLTGQPDRMWLSLKKLAKLPPKTRVVSGHGPETEIGKESWLSHAQELFS